jgi:outer membrane usher protein
MAMRWHWPANELPRALLIALPALLAPAGSARAGAAQWFGPDPCPPDAAALVPLAGGHALLRVHAHPGQAPEDTLLVRGHDALWRVPYETWSGWTPLPPPRTETADDGSRWAVLAADDGLAMRDDACTAELWIDANPQRLQQASFDDWDRTELDVPARGGYLNLDGRYGGLAGIDAASALVDLGLFGPGGSGRAGLYADRDRLRRLDASWIVDDRARLTRLRLGDTITRGADWEAPVRFAGIQWGTEFALQPERITFPLPSIAGSAALASTAELYVNGIRQARPQPLQPGAFRFDSVPTLTGSGELSVTLRDALGREQTIRQPFYASPRLLAAGLRERIVEAGFLREDYAGPDDRYTQPLLGMSLREGLSDRVTLLTRVGATTDRQLAGLELATIVSRLGLFSGSLAASHGEDGAGGIATLAYERIGERASVSLRRRMASRAYADIGRAPGSLRVSDAARLSWRLPGSGTASLVYVSEQGWGEVAGTRLAGLGLSQPLGRDWQAYASALHALGGRGTDSVVIGLTSVFGRNASGGVQASRNGDAGSTRLFAQAGTEGPLGGSWRVNADPRADGLHEAEAAWSTPRGTVALGYAGFGGRDAPSAAVQTAFAVVDGHGYWSRPIRDSFAVVDTGGIAGVHVLRENLAVGTSDRHGRLLLTDLQPFQRNRLAIDDRDLPVGLGLVSGSRVVVPPAGAGVVARFAVDARPARHYRLVDDHGQPVPAGAALWLDGERLVLPVGYDGLVYGDFTAGDDAPRRHRLSARWHGGACSLRLPAAIPDGPLVCRSTQVASVE